MSKNCRQLRPHPIWLSSEYFSSNYIQTGQHVVLLHILILLTTTMFQHTLGRSRAETCSAKRKDE